MRTGIVVVVLVASACNQVFGLHETSPITADAAVYDPCAPIVFDQNRYTALPSVGTWQMGRTSCQMYGMDLAVIDANDPDEIANELDGGKDPFWFGVNYSGSDWVAIDGCTPYLPSPPPAGMTGQCILQNNGMQAHACDNIAGITLNALCETPRPDAQCLELEAHSTYTVASASAIPYQSAVAMCSAMGMHLVEINSTAELDTIVQGVAAGMDMFWVAAQVTATGISSATTCPQVFSWGNSQPDFSGDTCVWYGPGGMAVVACTASAAAVCEANAAPM